MEEGEAITLESLPQWFIDCPTQGPESDRAVFASLQPDIRTAARDAQRETIMACLKRHGHDLQGKNRQPRSWASA